MREENRRACKTGALDRKNLVILVCVSVFFFFNLQIFDSYMYDEDGNKPFVCLIKKL